MYMYLSTATAQKLAFSTQSCKGVNELESGLKVQRAVESVSLARKQIRFLTTNDVLLEKGSLFFHGAEDLGHTIAIWLYHQ